MGTMSTEELSRVDSIGDLGFTTEELAPSSSLDTTLVEPSNHYSPGVTSSVEDRALALLGGGVNQAATAAALGVTEARISQLLAEESFASKVSELKYAALTKHNKRDGRYDDLEDKLLAKLDRAVPLLIRPMDIQKVLATVNGAKRRGHTTTNEVTNTQNIVNLILPSVITDRFVTDINNQVIKAGNQELLTMASSKLLATIEDTKQDSGEITNVQEQRS